MRTDCISAASMASHSNGQRMNFKGLWGESYFTHTQNLYGNEIECDYYEVPYHPCADETKAEIREQILKKQKELDPLNAADAKCYHGSYTTAVEGGRLPINKKQLSDIVSDCKEILAGNVPLKSLRKVLKLK